MISSRRSFYRFIFIIWDVVNYYMSKIAHLFYKHCAVPYFLVKIILYLFVRFIV